MCREKEKKRRNAKEKCISGLTQKGIKGKKIFKDHITLFTLFYFKRILRELSSCVSFMLRATICGSYDRRRETEIPCLWELYSLNHIELSHTISLLITKLTRIA
jgi:hypothetical protein